MSQKFRNSINIIILFLLINIYFFSSSSLAAALPYGSIITDNKGLTLESDGKYLVDIENALPGETYKKEFMIRSSEKIDPYDLSLRVKKVESHGNIDWNDHVLLTLTLDGKQIYQGKLLGDGKKDWSKEDLLLGKFEYGTERKLVAKFEIDKTLTNEDFSKVNTLLYNWQFIATRKGVPIEDSKKKDAPFLRLPQTGEEWREFIYQAIAGILLILLAILIWKNRRKNHEKENEN